MLIQDSNYGEALIILDKAIDSFKYTDEKLYATTIYRLFKLRADLYKRNGDFEKFDENISEAFESLMRASHYYSLLKKGRYAFLKTLTQEERFLLLTKTNFFTKSSMPYR